MPWKPVFTGVAIIGLCAACGAAGPTAVRVKETPMPGAHTAAPATATAAPQSKPPETDTPSPPTDTPTRAPVASTKTPETAAPATAASPPSPPACSAGRGLIENGSFDHDTTHWERPYGTLAHTAIEYLSAPGAAQLITSHSSDSLERLGTFGQCIDFREQLADWAGSDGEMRMIVEAYLKTDEGIASASLNAIFLGGPKCRGEHVAALYPGSVSGGHDWTRVSGTAAVPATARSLHVFVWATGLDESGTVYVDDIQACPSGDPELSRNGS